MNQKTKLMAEEETYKRYHIPSMPNYARRTKNSIYFNAGSSVKHELAKATGALMLQKWGDVKFNESTIKALKALSESIETAFKDWSKNKASFITEAVPNTEPNRRVDLLRLLDDTRYEFETNHKIKKDEDRDNTITIQI